MKTLDEYASWLAQQDDLTALRQEAMERMRVNVGLIAENTELRRRVQQLEEGRGAEA